MTAQQRPESAVPMRNGLAGLAGLALALCATWALRPHPLLASWLLLLSASLPMLWLELKSSSPLLVEGEGRQEPLLWLTGFAVASLPPLLLLSMAMAPVNWAIGWTVASVPFAIRYAVEWRLGRLSLWSGFCPKLARAVLNVDVPAVRALGQQWAFWMLKGFFIPLYGYFLFMGVVHLTSALPVTPIGWLFVIIAIAFTIDLTFGIAGYVFASEKLFHSVVSLQPRLIGWLACFFCYSTVSNYWPQFGAILRNEHSWPSVLDQSPELSVAVPFMLAILAIYVSATIAFGLRFSNLTNRGVITTGPYRLMKHPAYFGHVATAWITVLLFSRLDAAMLIALVAFTAVYRLRAVTEETHLRENPQYVEYEAWIREHGLLGRASPQILLRSNPARASANNFAEKD